MIKQLQIWTRTIWTLHQTITSLKKERKERLERYVHFTHWIVDGNIFSSYVYCYWSLVEYPCILPSFLIAYIIILNVIVTFRQLCLISKIYMTFKCATFIFQIQGYAIFWHMFVYAMTWQLRCLFYVARSLPSAVILLVNTVSYMLYFLIVWKCDNYIF